MEQSATKRIAKNFSWLLAGNIIAGIFNVLTVIYIARVLGAAAYGQLQFAMAFLLYLVIMIDSGLSFLGTREIARNKGQAEGISTNLIVLRVAIALALYLFAAVVLLLISLAPAVRLLFLAAFSLVFYRALNTDWLFQGLEKMEYMAFSKVLFNLLSFASIVLLVKGPADLLKVPLAQSICGLFLAILFIFIANKYLIKFQWSSVKPQAWKQICLLAGPLAASTILMLIYDNMDTILLGVMDKPVVVGYYNAAYRIFYVFSGIFSLWLATAVPIASKKISDNLEGAALFLGKFLKLTMLLIIPATILVFLIAPIIVRLIFGGEYLPAILALNILIWALIPLAISNTYGGLILMPAGHFKQFFWVAAAGAGINLLLNLALIPRFSYLGSALATVIAQAFAGLVAFYLSRKILRLGLLKQLISPLAISAVGLIAYWIAFNLLRNGGLYWQLLLSGLAFSLAALLALFFREKTFIAQFIQELRSGEINAS